MTHVADKATLAKYFRFIHGVSERAIKGSLDIEQFIRVAQVLLDKGERAKRLVAYVTHGCPVVDLATQDTFNINLDKLPFTPEGYRNVQHDKGGMLVFNPADVMLHLDAAQQGDGRVKGGTLCRKLERLQNPMNLNACVLDWFLENPTYVPEEWKGLTVHFWGTIYKDKIGDWFVRYLYWDDAQWCSGIRYISGYCSWFGSNSPAAVYSIH